MLERRSSLLVGAHGRVLEIGFGTGHNLPFYCAEKMESLVGIDPNPGMVALASPRIAEARFPTEVWTASAETIPAPDASFDCVVSAWTLCSIPAVERALREARRVLRPRGTFLFVEHGLSPDVSVRRWQHLLEPIWRHIGDGCHLSRQPVDLIQGAGFRLQECTESYLPGLPRWGAYTYQGRAVHDGGTDEQTGDSLLSAPNIHATTDHNRDGSERPGSGLEEELA